MALFGPSNRDLSDRLDALAARFRELEREWASMQTDLLETQRKAANAVRSLGRQLGHLEAREKAEAVTQGGNGAPPLDPRAQAILDARRRHRVPIQPVSG